MTMLRQPLGSQQVAILVEMAPGIAGYPRRELLIASLVNHNPAEYCSGVGLDPHHGGYLLKRGKYTNVTHLEDILETGRFALEIPETSFLSDLLAEKLRKAEP